MAQRQPAAVVYGALVLLVVIWGTTWAAIRVGLEGVPPFTGVALRFAIAAAALWFVARLWGITLAAGRQVRRLWAVNGAFTFCLSYGVVYWAEQWVPSSLSSVLFSTFPLFVAVMAHFWLPNERLTGLAVAGVLLGFAGVLVIYSDDLGLASRQQAVAAIVFLISPLAAAAASVLTKRWGEGLHAFDLTVVPMAGTAAVMGLLAVIFERHRVLTFDPVSIGALLYLSIGGSAVTFTLYFWLLSRLPATRLALITYAIPLVAIAIGAGLLDEPLTWRIAVGAGLVLLGVGLASRRAHRPSPDS